MKLFSKYTLTYYKYSLLFLSFLYHCKNTQPIHKMCKKRRFPL